MSKYDIPRPRLEEISELAEYYAGTYCRVSQVIAPQDIATAIGLKFSAGNYKEAFDGLTRFKNGRFHVFINLRETDHLFSPRVRYSFAHELGHYTMESHRTALMTPGVKPHASFADYCFDSETEREAEFYASCLLMPAGMIKKDIAKRKFDFVLVDELRSKYQVSVTAALLRLMALDMRPFMVVCTRNGKIAWQRCSHDFPFYKIMRGLNDAVPVNTGGGEYYTDGTRYNTTQTVYAGDWFLLLSSADQRRPFHEHCIYYEPLDQVTSVLWED
jgi:Zn-dependent peptidase ImmA (M78 family)